MTDAPKTNTELLDECLAENARHGWDADELRDAVLARMVEPKRVIRILCIDEVDEWPPGFVPPSQQVKADK